MKAKHRWDNNKHTITILEHLLWPNQVYWCEKCKRYVPKKNTPGEEYALKRAIGKLGGHIKRSR